MKETTTLIFRSIDNNRVLTTEESIRIPIRNFISYGLDKSSDTVFIQLPAGGVLIKCGNTNDLLSRLDKCFRDYV